MSSEFWAYILIYVPILLFVIGFLYETYLSFIRLGNPRAGKAGYVAATWEVTHTLLVFGVVMLLMLYTKVIDEIASRIFLATFLAAVALGIRGAAYIYIFYVRKSRARTGWVDWLFACSHVAAAGLLVVVVVQASWYLLRENPPLNEQFIGPFLPGLFLVLMLCAVPLTQLYRSK
jgi:cytochrome bd-type quinol oxidase subunit 2